MPKSKSERAKYVRSWRKETYEQKRFNKPLREYLEIKYRDIFNEYSWFYRSLNEEHPGAKDLTKTKTYKAWKKRQLNCEGSDPEMASNQAENDEMWNNQPGNDDPLNEQSWNNEPANEDPVNEQPWNNEPANEDPVNEQPGNNEPANDDPVSNNILSEALPEPLSPNNINVDQVNDIIQEIIDGLEQDQAVRDLLNEEGLVHPHYQDEDEGLGLDVEVELEAIIEPFDYEEVEGFDF